MKLANKVAIITGAASGIGKTIAMNFAREGAKVAIADLNLDAANATAQEIVAAGGQAMGVAMNVCDEQAGEDQRESEQLVSRRRTGLSARQGSPRRRRLFPAPRLAAHCLNVSVRPQDSCAGPA